MGITDIFRPKHRHSNAAVRADAVQQMGSDQGELLIQIARSDADPSVRALAVERIDDASVLQELAADESSADVRKKARARAARLWAADAIDALTLVAASPAMKGLLAIDDQFSLAEIAHRATNLDVRGDALARLSDPRALAELARTAPAAELRAAAIARIEDVDVLRKIAVDEMRKQVALAALDRISDAEVIDSIATKAKSKQVRNRARKWLAAQKQVEVESSAPSESRRLHAGKIQLIHQVEKLGKVHEWLKSHAQVEKAEAAWAELGGGGDATLVERFRAAVDLYRGRRKKFGKADVDEAAAKAAAQARAEQRESAPEEVHAPEASAPEDSQSGSVLQEAVAGGGAASVEEPAEQSEATEADPEAIAAAAAKAAADADAAAAAKAEADAKRADAAATKAAAEAKRAEAQTQILEQFQAICVELEGALAFEHIKPVERVLRDAAKNRSRLRMPRVARRDELEARYEEAHNKLFSKVQDLRKADDWERWSNVPRKEALVGKAEALLADEDTQAIGRKLKDLQAEWKAVGAVPQKKGQELWDKFKAICDQIYERVKVERKRTSAEFAGNLEQKRAMCVRAEELAESTDWKETAETIKRLQVEWRAIGPVPRKQSDATWKRFRGACDLFFERRKPHLEKALAEFNQNLETKQALCDKAEGLSEKAEALCESAEAPNQTDEATATSEEWEEMAGTLQTLQRDWRDVGHVPRKDANAINKRFRAACDAFYKRRDEAKAQERELAIGAVRSQLEKVNTSVASDDIGNIDGAALAQDTLAMRTAFFALGRSRGDDAEALRAEVDAACLGALETSAPSFSGTDLDIDVSMKRKSKLCERAEKLAPEAEADAGAVSVSDAPALVAERLRAAMAGNTFSEVEDPNAVSMGDLVGDLRDSWARLGPVPGSLGQALESQFQDACQRALDAGAK